jgi:hypothetical protein
MRKDVVGHGVCTNCKKILHLKQSYEWLHAEQLECDLPEIKTCDTKWAGEK